MYRAVYLLKMKAAVDTQPVEALSSGSLGMCKDFGKRKKVIVETGAIAGRGMDLRLGVEL